LQRNGQCRSNNCFQVRYREYQGFMQRTSMTTLQSINVLALAVVTAFCFSNPPAGARHHEMFAVAGR